MRVKKTYFRPNFVGKEKEGVVELPSMPVADVSKDPVVNQWLSSNDLIAHIACKDSPE